MCLYSFPEVFSQSTQKKTIWPLTEVFHNLFFTILPYSSYIIFEQLFTDDDSNLVIGLYLLHLNTRCRMQVIWKIHKGCVYSLSLISKNDDKYYFLIFLSGTI